VSADRRASPSPAVSTSTPGHDLKSPKKSPKKNSGKRAKNGQQSVYRNNRQQPPGREPRRESGSQRPQQRSQRSQQRSGGRRAGLDTPLDSRWMSRGPVVDSEAFGRWSETFARFMGTAWFIVGMTVFVGAWLSWNALAPGSLQFDPRRLNFTLMTLILSLQASYAAPLILLAQNRQADRDRVSAEQDRDRAERALADTEYLAREVAALRIAVGEVATRDFVRSELRTLIEELGPTRKPARKHSDSFGSTQDAQLPTDSG